MADFYFAASGTTHASMQWLILYMAAHQKIQKKLQEEVDSVLPKGTPFTDDSLNE